MADVSTNAASSQLLTPRLFANSGPWLFGRGADLALFGGSAALALLLTLGGHFSGHLDGESPEWVFFAAVLLVDVAHVWTTLFRVYFDGAEVRRRPWVYLGLPALLYGLSVMAHAVGSDFFWRVLAYVAVFHFVRQQVGWMRLYDGRDKNLSSGERRLNAGAIYLATLYPVLWWHGHLPRTFWWFVEGDFVGGALQEACLLLSGWLLPLHIGIASAFVAVQLRRLSRGDGQPGKLLLWLTTAACWHVGIVFLNSDVAFTLTNVLIHGVPYFGLTFAYGRFRAGQQAKQSAEHVESDSGHTPLLQRLLLGPNSLKARRSVLAALSIFLGTVLLFALVEEVLWDRWVWHERAYAFGEGRTVSEVALTFLVPLLSLPQLTHYALDGIVWRRSSNPTLRSE